MRTIPGSTRLWVLLGSTLHALLAPCLPGLFPPGTECTDPDPLQLLCCHTDISGLSQAPRGAPTPLGVAPLRANDRPLSRVHMLFGFSPGSHSDGATPLIGRPVVTGVRLGGPTSSPQGASRHSAPAFD